MRCSSGATVGLLLVAFSMAGCLEGSMQGDDLATDAGAAAAPLASFVLPMKGCVEAGSVSMYNQNANSPFVPKPWKEADINDDMGNPRFGSYGVPITGRTTGIWHMVVVCDAYGADGAKARLAWGWVGVRIQPPPWDDGTVPRQFILADLSFGDKAVVEQLRTLTGMRVANTLSGKFEWVAPTFMHSVLDDDSHGTFETHAGMKQYRKLELASTRFWFPTTDGPHEHGDAIFDAEGAKYRPVSLDLVHEIDAQGQYWVINEGARAFTHTKKSTVGPATVPQMEHYGYTGGAVAYTAFGRTITVGPAPTDILLDTTWTH